MPYTAFISDLHLTRTRPEINRVFFEFLEGPGRAAEALYILGDLFEYWAGDDDLRDPLNARVASALKTLVEAAVPVYLMHGNRDFLMLEGFVHASGVRLLEDPTILNLYGTRTVLLHGDTLCTDDKRYQAFRRRARNRCWQRLFLLQPLWLRRARIERARARSERRKQRMGAEIMDVTPSAVEQSFRDSGCARMIHGHTHRPAHHMHIVDGRRCERWVLADWYRHGQYLRVDREGCLSVDLA
ncbi:MAG TPA: UDP-2,3-diacylglucosamine diphosphatase [Burkholderiales bacterium]|nr:UDP-2,3-diacylglucosamine diphosphatase [Burkholderiales bacterium]